MNINTHNASPQSNNDKTQMTIGINNKIRDKEYT